MHETGFSQMPFSFFRLRRQDMSPQRLFPFYFTGGGEPKVLLHIAPGLHFWHDLRFLLWGLR